MGDDLEQATDATDPLQPAAMTGLVVGALGGRMIWGLAAIIVSKLF